MRVLLIVPAIPTHLNLLVPMAWALRAAGDDVCVASQPNLLDSITSSGLTAVAAGNSLDVGRTILAPYAHRPETAQRAPFRSAFDIRETRPEKLTWDYVRSALMLHAGAMSNFLADDTMLEDLVEFARGWRPDLVIWDSSTYVGPIVAKACGAANVRSLSSPDYVGRMRARFGELAAHQVPSDSSFDPVGEWLSRRSAKYGGEFDEELILGQATLDSVSRWMGFDTNARYLPVRFVPYNGRSAFPDWIHRPAARPRVCVTLGSTAAAFGLRGLSVMDILAEVAGLDVEVIATVGREQLPTEGTLPDNVRLFDFVPLDHLLPTCSAVVHHFGMGTLGTAIVHGVPQLRVRGGVDGAGDRELVERGAALSLDSPELLPGAIADAVARLISEPSFRESAARLQAEVLAMPSPAHLVPELREIARSG